MADSLFPGWSHSSIGIAPDALEGEAEMLAQFANGVLCCPGGIFLHSWEDRTSPVHYCFIVSHLLSRCCDGYLSVK